MGRNEGWVQRLTTNLQEESLPGVPVVEIAGDRRVLIECHCGVTEYGPGGIGVRVKFGTIMVRGSSLCLSHMSRERLVVSGQIDSVELIRREKHGGRR